MAQRPKVAPFGRGPEAMSAGRAAVQARTMVAAHDWWLNRGLRALRDALAGGIDDS
jgi:hypothetical protein